MLVHKLVKFCFSASRVCLTVLVLSATLVTGMAQAGEMPSTVPIIKKSTRAVATNSGSSLANGTYLYGESTEPGRIGSEYIVFDNQDGQAVGAVFMTDSEYSCFSGKVQHGQLNMQVLDSYEQVERSYAVALEGSTGDTSSLEYRAVQDIGRQELSLLESCRNMYRSRFSKLSIRG
jgi:hypothetical protein